MDTEPNLSRTIDVSETKKTVFFFFSTHPVIHVFKHYTTPPLLIPGLDSLRLPFQKWKFSLRW